MRRLLNLMIVISSLLVIGSAANAALIFSDNWNDGTLQTPTFASPGVDWAVEAGSASVYNNTALLSPSENSRIGVNFGATTGRVEARFKLFQGNAASPSNYVFDFGFTDTTSGKSQIEYATLNPGFFGTSGFQEYWSGTNSFKAGLPGASITNSWSFMKLIFDQPNGMIEVWQAIDGDNNKTYNDAMYTVPWQMVASWDNNYWGITSVDKFFLENGGGVVSWQVDDVEIDVVPEPSSILALAAGLLSTIGAVRRKH